MTFAKSYDFGRVGEGAVEKWLKDSGYSVLPVYEVEKDVHKGPRLFMLDKALICPDMFAFRADGDARWIEAKTKSAFTWHQITETWQTGINKRHWEDYQKVDRETPWRAYLIFLHLDGRAVDTPQGMTSPTGLFGRSVANLSQCVDHEWGDPPMVYWKYEDLRKLAALEDL